MPAVALAQNICNALKGAVPGKSAYTAGSPATMNALIAAEITKYIVANGKVMTSYVGVIPGVPPVPESAPGVHNVAGTCAPPGIASSYEAWIDEIGQNISTGFMTLPCAVIPKGSHVSFQVPMTKISALCPQSALKSAHKGAWGNPQLQVWTKICQGIFDMINTQVSPPFPAGIAGSGVATVTKLMLT